MPTVTLKSKEILYRILISSIRETIGIEVTMDNGVMIRTPPNTEDITIQRFLQDKEDWILKKLDKFNEIENHPHPKEFVAGERLSYIGRSYRLHVKSYDKKRIKFSFSKGKFLLYIPKNKERDNSKIREKVVEWYKIQAAKKLQERVDYLAPKIGKSPSNVKVREFKSRWGTCQDDDSIDFNWRIIMAPMSIIDYVIVHELSHLVTRDHSKNFWSKLSAIIVDHEKRKEWLRVNGPTLTL